MRRPLYLRMVTGTLASNRDTSMPQGGWNERESHQFELPHEALRLDIRRLALCHDLPIPSRMRAKGFPAAAAFDFPALSASQPVPCAAYKHGTGQSRRLLAGMPGAGKRTAVLVNARWPQSLTAAPAPHDAVFAVSIDPRDDNPDRQGCAVLGAITNAAPVARPSTFGLTT